MKKIKFSTLLFQFLFILFFISLCTILFAEFSVRKSPTPPARISATRRGSADGVDDSVKDQLSNLDFQELQDYLNSLEGFENTSVVERLFKHIKGAKFDYTDFGKKIGEVLFAKIADVLPAFACITAVTLLSGLLSTLKSSTAGQTSSEMIFVVTYAAALIPVLSVLTEAFQEAISCVASMRKQMQLVYPPLLTLMATSGGGVTAAVCRPAVAFFSTSIVSIIDSVVFPLTITIIAFSMAGKLTTQLKIGKFTAFFKSVNKWIIGICVSVFGIFFTLQGITAATYDGVARRAAKYAIGNGIPIVGGFLSGGFDLAVAGSVLIKNSLGSMSIFLLVSVLFEPLVLLIAVNLLLRLVSAITQPFGDSRISDFLGETAGNLHYCTAGLLFTAFLYFLSIMIMIFSTEALF